MINNEIVLRNVADDTIWCIVTQVTKDEVTLVNATWFDINNDEFENFAELVVPWNEITSFKINRY